HEMSKPNESHETSQVNLHDAERFLESLDGIQTPYCFQTIPNRAGKRVPRIYYGTLEEVKGLLIDANLSGDGVFVTINETNGKGRTADDITGVRSCFVDDDNGRLAEITSELYNMCLTPHMVVESSPGKGHCYLHVKNCPRWLFRAIQTKLAKKFGTDPKITDLPRVMRLPGFLHTKGEPFLSHLVELNDHPKYSVEEIEAALGLDDLDSSFSNTKSTACLERGYPDGQRTEALTQLVGKLIRARFSDQEIMQKLIPWNENNTPPLSLEKLVKTINSIRKSDDRKKFQAGSILEQMNEICAVAMMGTKCIVILNEGNGPVFTSPQDMEKYYANRKLPDGKPLFKHWFEHEERRTYQGIVFAPAGAGPHLYNLFEGFAVEGLPGSCELFLAHLLEVICSGNLELYEYCLDWMADLVQHPDKLCGVALVLMGSQGAGKGVFVEYFGKLFGKHFQHVSNPEHLVGRFNGNLASTLLVFADEAFWAGDKAKLGALKTLITESRRMIEMKHKDALEVENYARVIMASNEDWVVPAEVDERRFCATRVSDSRKGDTKYFEAIIHERDNGGVEALMHLLKNRVLEGKDLRKFPVTGALLGQKVRNLKSHEQWLYDHLQMAEVDGKSFDDSFVKTRLYNSYVEYCHRLHKRGIVDSGTFFKWLRRTIPGIADSRPLLEGKAVRHVTFPSLDECRKAFEGWIGGSIPWE
ncbi:DUF5906 domain-containing protein, partial [Endozoicomonas sp. SESOKO2]|uniref:DUF5906 domain-containing protein n=1 Tax=Endozoicomonas sp. SESOKO2 TaxID=2828743 RepID=UPI0021485E54